MLELTRESEILAAKTRLHDRIGAGLIAIRQTLLGTQTAEEGAKSTASVPQCRAHDKIR